MQIYLYTCQKEQLGLELSQSLLLQLPHRISGCRVRANDPQSWSCLVPTDQQTALEAPPPRLCNLAFKPSLIP